MGLDTLADVGGVGGLSGGVVDLGGVSSLCIVFPEDSELSLGVLGH